MSANNFLEQARRNIIETNNTAQAQLESMIRHLMTTSHNQAVDLMFPNPLSGDIDFSLLPTDIKSFLKNIRAIAFSKGEITSIQGWNVMPKLQKVEIKNNYLIELGIDKNDAALPWIDVDFESNGIETIEWSKLKHVKYLNIAKNQFKKLDKLPDGLETLHCENNQIIFLNLSNCSKLIYAECSDNSTDITILAPPLETNANIINNRYTFFPDKVVDNADSPVFQITPKNSPIFQITPKEIEQRVKDIETDIEYKEALRVYFQAKKQYEEDYGIDKKIVWDRNARSNGKKQAQLLVRSVVPKCIYCKQAGGMVFKVKNDTYIAHCAAANPCKFKIEVYRGGDYQNLYNLWKESIEYLEKDKQALIELQHDIEYGYVDEMNGLKREKDLKSNYELSKKILEDMEAAYEALYSEERKENIRKKQKEIYELIGTNDALLSSDPISDEDQTKKSNEKSKEKTPEDYDEDEETQKKDQEMRIEMAVDNEIKTLFPAIQTLRYLVYDNAQVVNEYRQEYLKPISDKSIVQRLFQEKITLGNLDYSIDEEEPEVLAFSGV